MTQTIQRRVFLMTLATSTAAVGSLAQAQVLLDEKDPQAMALGYVADAKRVDTKKYPKFAAGQGLHQLRALSGQAHRQASRLPAVWCQAGGRCGLVQRVGQEGLIRHAARRVSGARR